MKMAIVTDLKRRSKEENFFNEFLEGKEEQHEEGDCLEEEFVCFGAGKATEEPFTSSWKLSQFPQPPMKDH